jgi:hypothetical protein
VLPKYISHPSPRANFEKVFPVQGGKRKHSEGKKGD